LAKQGLAMNRFVVIPRDSMRLNALWAITDTLEELPDLCFHSTNFLNREAMHQCMKQTAHQLNILNEQLLAYEVFVDETGDTLGGASASHKDIIEWDGETFQPGPSLSLFPLDNWIHYK